MRRFFAFLMCVSGLTLAVTWTRADEPAVAATPEEALPAEEAAPPRPPETPHPPSRPVVIRTEPGSHQEAVDKRPPGSGVVPELNQRLQELQARLEKLQATWAPSKESVEQGLRRVENLQRQLEELPDKYAGRALADTREHLEKQVARIEKLLGSSDVQQAEAVARAQDEVAEERTSDEKPNPERRPDAYREMRRNRERARGAISERVETQLDQLRKLAEELIESGTDEAEVARREIEQQIDNLERYLAERRERRDAAERHDRATAEHHEADDDLQRRLRHIGAAIEHLEAAGMPEMAQNVRKHAEQLQRENELRRAVLQQQHALEQQMREIAEHRNLEMERRRAGREEAEAAPGRPHDEADRAPAVQDLAEQFGDLRRELRQLRQEVQELRELKAQPDDE